MASGKTAPTATRIVVQNASTASGAVVRATPSGELWLELMNVRFVLDSDGQTRLEVQLKAQRTDSEEKSWWPVRHGAVDAATYFKSVTEALDKKRATFVRIAVEDGQLVADALRIDYVS